MLLFTIGHSVHTTESFVSILDNHAIRSIVDVRSVPYSRRNPQFNREVLKTDLLLYDIAYHYMGDTIGGRARNDEFLFPDGKVNYTSVRTSTPFQSGIRRLLDLARQTPTALMCAEKDPFNCHRFVLIGKELTDRDIEVHHIVGPDSIHSQQDLENRLLEKYGLNSRQPGLFDTRLSREKRVQKAYLLRNRDIAYAKK